MDDKIWKDRLSLKLFKDAVFIGSFGGIEWPTSAFFFSIRLESEENYKNSSFSIACKSTEINIDCLPNSSLVYYTYNNLLEHSNRNHDKMKIFSESGLTSLLQSKSTFSSDAMKAPEF